VRLPTKKVTRELQLRCGRDKYGLGLVMSTNNTVMAVEPGGVAARERRLRPGDQITNLDGEALGGVRLSEALRLKAEAEAASGARAPAPPPGAPLGGAVHNLTVTRHLEQLPDGVTPDAPHAPHACPRPVAHMAAAHMAAAHMAAAHMHAARRARCHPPPTRTHARAHVRVRMSLRTVQRQRRDARPPLSRAR
jgi:hypothetical protein